MKRCTAVLLIALTLEPRQALADTGHLVSPADIAGALSRDSASRMDDIAALQQFLAAPPVVQTAAHLGVRPGVLSRNLSSLTDAELHEVAARARLVTVDPSAGSTHVGGYGRLIIIGVLVLLVLLLGMVLPGPFDK